MLVNTDFIRFPFSSYQVEPGCCGPAGPVAGGVRTAEVCMRGLQLLGLYHH